MKKNIIQNRRIKDDMHCTKGIENKNDGIEEKRFTNCKKDRMEKNMKKSKKKIEGQTEIAVRWAIGF